MKGVGVLLAGGASTRMGRPKALIEASGESYAVRGVRGLWAACDRVVVVLGSGAPKLRPALEAEFEALVSNGGLRRDMAAARKRGAKGLELHFVVNRAWRRGMLSSVRVGLEEALKLGAEAVLVHAVDHPDVKPATIATLAGAMSAALTAYRGKRKSAPFAYALVPRHGRRGGHPIALSRALARDVALDGGAATLSEAVRRNARLVGYLDCTDRGILANRNRSGDR